MSVVICCIIKDEHSYLDNWIRYHLNLGIDTIYLYEDRGSTSHKDITNKYESVRLVQLSDPYFDFLFEADLLYPGGKQIALFNWFMLTYYTTYDWSCFIDIDEFININLPLSELLDTKEDVVSLPWRILSNNSSEPYSNNNSYVDYSQYYQFGCIPPKSFIRLKKFLPMTSAHTPIDANGYKANWNESGELGYIDHFYTRSWHEWCNRFLKKGDLIPGNRAIWEFFRVNPGLVPYISDLMKSYWDRFDELYKVDDTELIISFVFDKSVSKLHHVTAINDLDFDLLAYEYSFNLIHKFVKTKLYVTESSKSILDHIPYDEVVILNDDIVTDSKYCILIEALSLSGDNECFIHADTFIQLPYIFDFLKRDKHDLIVTKERLVNKSVPWSWIFQDQIINTVSPELMRLDNSCFDTSILMIRNKELKLKLIGKYLDDYQIYLKSKLKRLYDLSNSFDIGRTIFECNLYELSKDYDVNPFFSRKVLYDSKQFDEMVKFFGFIHLTERKRTEESISKLRTKLVSSLIDN